MSRQIAQHPVPLILKAILKEQSSGELIVKGEGFLKVMYFQDGALIFARTTVIEERLGEILFKIGKIDRAQFDVILNLVSRKTGHEKLGKMLVDQKIISQRDLYFALLYQSRAIATSVFTILSGEWEFFAKVPSTPADSRFNIELPGIISEGANRLSNFSYFKNKFHHLAPKTIPIPERLGDFLSAYEISFYKKISAFRNISASEIMVKMEMSEEAFWKKVILFHLLNIIDFSEIEVHRELDKNVEEVIRIFAALKESSIDYYALLKLDKTAGFNEIKNAYFDLAKKYHPDRMTGAPDPDIKEKANYVFAEINRAYEILSNEEKKRQYDSRGFRDDIQVDESMRDNMLERSRALYRKAKSHYTQKKFWEAVAMLDEAVAIDDQKAPFFLLLGLCQMNLANQRRMAEKNLQKAIDLEPFNVEAFVAMGVLFMSEGHMHRAEGFFRKALSLNPDHPLARKKIAEISDARPDAGKKGFGIFGKKK